MWRFDRKKSGASLLEFVCILGVTAILLAVSVGATRQSLDTLYFRYVLHNVYQFASQARTIALAHEANVVLELDAQMLLAIGKDSQYVYAQYQLPKHWVLTINKFGFTKQGRTQHAGSLRLKHAHRQGRISLGVGYGKLSVYF